MVTINTLLASTGSGLDQSTTTEARPITPTPGPPITLTEAEPSAQADGLRTHHHLVEEQERPHRQEHGPEQEGEKIPDRIPGVHRSVATADSQ